MKVFMGDNSPMSTTRSSKPCKTDKTFKMKNYIQSPKFFLKFIFLTYKVICGDMQLGVGDGDGERVSEGHT
jgi:hypothetical protein